MFKADDQGEICHPAHALPKANEYNHKVFLVGLEPRVQMYSTFPTLGIFNTLCEIKLQYII